MLATRPLLSDKSSRKYAFRFLIEAPGISRDCSAQLYKQCSNHQFILVVEAAIFGQALRPNRSTRMAFSVRINSRTYRVDVDGDTPLLWVIRDVLGMTGTKFGCGQALCGACTVHIDGAPTRSCITPIESVAESQITTIEALNAVAHGRALQDAWIELEVPQCGYCQSGQLMSAAALLNENSKPTDEDINNAMSGNVCRCGTYQRIRAAIKRASASGETR